MAELKDVPVFWIRHGENPANIRRQLSHRVVDYDLTALGVEQAEYAGRRLRYRGLCCRTVFSSPLLRARSTAAVIARWLEAGVQVVEEFRELDVGEIDGRTDQAAWRLHDSVIRHWMHGCFQAAFPGGENRSGAGRRAGEGLLHAFRCRSQENEPIVVVSHSGLLRAAVAELAQPPIPMPSGTLATGAVAELSARFPAGQDEENDLLSRGLTLVLRYWPDQDLGAPAESGRHGRRH